KEKEAAAQVPPAAATPVAVAAAVKTDAPKLVTAVPRVAASSAVRAPPPMLIIERDEEPLHRKWWVWAGAGAIAVATVTSFVALGVASARPGSSAPPPKYGKLDAR